MKCCSKITFFAVLCVLCTSFLNLDAMHPEERMLRNLHQNIYQKHYVKHKDVLVTKDGIFVLENGRETPVRHLYTDSQGRIYYKTSAVEKGYTQSTPCKNGCGSFFGRNCPKCGWPDKEKKKD